MQLICTAKFPQALINKGGKMAQLQCNDVVASTEIKAATINEYRALVVEFHLKQRDAWLKHLYKRGVIVADAEDVFSSVIEYLLKPQTHTNYLSKCKNLGTSFFKYNPKMKGLAKLPCFIKLVYQVFKTKISHYFRGCKRQLAALKAYFETISTGNKINGKPVVSVDEKSNPEQIAVEAEEKSSAPADGIVVLLQNTIKYKINPSHQVAA